MTKTTETIATLEARFADLPGEAVWQLADVLMTALDSHPAAVGPMVVADAATGEIIVSFEFAAVGDPSIDVTRAMFIISEATANAPTPGARRAVEGATVLGVAIGWSSASVETPELAFA